MGGGSTWVSREDKCLQRINCFNQPCPGASFQSTVLTLYSHGSVCGGGGVHMCSQVCQLFFCKACNLQPVVLCHEQHLRRYLLCWERRARWRQKLCQRKSHLLHLLSALWGSTRTRSPPSLGNCFCVLGGWGWGGSNYHFGLINQDQRHRDGGGGGVYIERERNCEQGLDFRLLARVPGSTLFVCVGGGRYFHFLSWYRATTATDLTWTKGGNFIFLVFSTFSHPCQVGS